MEVSSSTKPRRIEDPKQNTIQQPRNMQQNNTMSQSVHQKPFEFRPEMIVQGPLPYTMIQTAPYDPNFEQKEQYKLYQYDLNQIFVTRQSQQMQASN